MQIALGLTDLAAVFAFPGNDAAPGPWFDDVRFYKYRIGGVALSTRTVDTANDAFPVSGLIDASTPAARDLLDVRFDMARDISSGDLHVPGDSVIVDAKAIIPNTSMTDLRLVWALRRNPLFNDVRNNPPVFEAGSLLSVSNFAAAGDVWTGEVVADTSKTAAPPFAIIQDRFYVDLPDEDFLYPGDILHYHLRATDSDGRVSTLPHDIDGFGQWDADGKSPYSRRWTVRALPSIVDASGSQPSLLLYNDFGRRGGEAEFLLSFAQLGLIEGVDWDSYTTQGPSSSVSNGIGSAGVVNSLGDRRGHGANVDQLAGYDTIVYLSGNLNTQLISDGSDEGQNDKSPDLAVLTSWKNRPGPRATIYFGDFVGSALMADSPLEGRAYLRDVMGIDIITGDVRSTIDGQVAPTVVPTGDVAVFQTSFIAFGGCYGINQFDALAPRQGAIRSHGFVDPTTQSVYDDVAAGIVFDRLVDGHRKLDVTFPYGDLYVYDDPTSSTSPLSARTVLWRELLTLADPGFTPGDTPTNAPPTRAASFDVHPNPFNPRTTMRFALPRAGVAARVEIFDARGRRVRTLFDDVSEDADLALVWDGSDDRRRRLASGVYLVRAVTDGFVGRKKIALVR